MTYLRAGMGNNPRALRGNQSFLFCETLYHFQYNLHSNQHVLCVGRTKFAFITVHSWGYGAVESHIAFIHRPDMGYVHTLTLTPTALHCTMRFRYRSTLIFSDFNVSLSQ